MVNRHNYLLTKEYLAYLDGVCQLDVRSRERYWCYLKYLLIWADETSFERMVELRPTFPSFLATVRLDGEQGKLAPSTLKKIIQTVKRFFTWLKLAYVREYRDLSLAWIEALRPPRGIELPMEHVFVTPGEVQHIIGFQVPAEDLALRRDQAAVALLFLSGMRASAFATLPIAAVDLSSRTIKQWPALGVDTKNGKSATTYLLDIPQLLAAAREWDDLIRTQLPATAMWYTPVIGQWGEQVLSSAAPGMNRGQAVSKRMRHLFRVVGLPPKSPHKFRHGHAVYALQHAKTMADYKAVSMNLMHEDIRVTDGIYAPLAGHEVQDRIASLTNSPQSVSPVNPELVTLLSALSKEQLSEALIAIAQQLAHE